MYINDLSPVAGSTHVDKRKGRGHATGNGKTAGRGHKGQKARSGGGARIGFEGGQMPLARRIPKRGFHNIFAKPLTAVNVAALDKFEDGAVVDAQALLDAGIISKCKYGVKFLGNGEVIQEADCQSCCFLRIRESRRSRRPAERQRWSKCFRHCAMHGRSKSCARRYSSRWSSSSFTVLATPSLFLYVNIALLNAYFAQQPEHHSRSCSTL